jgi:hypothetical protein
MMLATEIQAHARKLQDSFGTKAAVEAAQKAKRLEESGEKEQAQDWRRIEAALKQSSGPHAS